MAFISGQNLMIREKMSDSIKKNYFLEGCFIDINYIEMLFEILTPRVFIARSKLLVLMLSKNRVGARMGSCKISALTLCQDEVVSS